MASVGTLDRMGLFRTQTESRHRKMFYAQGSILVSSIRNENYDGLYARFPFFVDLRTL